MNVKHKIAREDRIKLSILVLSSGRYSTIERCLKSFEPIKQAIPTEIVVVNTDPRKKIDVQHIISRYADKITDFSWCDDFSAARNAGLAKAEGEWLLYIDDDEWLMDTKPIIDFLRFGNIEFNWCNLSVRNYFNTELTEYQDTWVSRLFRIYPDSRFEGIVHEGFRPIEGKPKILEAKIGHTGYIFQSEAENRRHSERNIRLLKKAIIKEPRNARLWVQIVQEYGALSDYDTQKRVCEKYIILSAKIKETEDNKRYVNNLRGLFVGCRVRIDVMTQHWQDAEKVFNAFAKEIGTYGIVADGFLCLMGMIFSYNQGNFVKTKVFCNGWLHNYSIYRENPTEYAEDEVYFLGEAFDKNAVTTIGVILEQIKKYMGEK